jgi:hypothetical protein
MPRHDAQTACIVAPIAAAGMAASREMGPGQRFPAKNCYRVIQGKIIRLAR